jgi:hypothetical protein
MKSIRSEHIVRLGKLTGKSLVGSNLRTVRKTAGRLVNGALGVAGLELKPRYYGCEQFLPFDRTIKESRSSGQTLGDFIDFKYSQPGATQATIDQLASFGVYSGNIERVCEVGPGSGRYLQKTIDKCHPNYYEIYETANVWGSYLAKTYNVIFQPTDGRSLSSTPDASIDLFQAHKVFVCTPYLTTYNYFLEIARVVRTSGKAVLDLVTENCMDTETAEAWLKSGPRGGYYPCITPRQFSIDFFLARGFRFEGSFFIPLRPGLTEVFVFHKTA